MAKPGSVQIETWILAIAIASGISGLGYEMVWTRILTMALGHEMPSVLGVLSAFFIGMSLGAWTLHGPIGRSPRPAVWYAFLETASGLWALGLACFLSPLSNHAVTWLGVAPSALEHWLFALLLPIVILLPATFAMGATLPALERWMSQLRQNGWVVGGVYGANTLGAAIGVTLTTFVITPQYGFFTTGLVMAAINLASAVAALTLDSGKSRRSHSAQAPYREGPERYSAPSRATGSMWVALFITGMLGIGLEVVVMRVLNQVLENTVFTFAVLLLIYLAGTSAGAWLYQFHGRNRHPDRVTDLLISFAAMGVVLTTVTLLLVQPLHLWLTSWLGKGVATAILSEISLAVLAFLPPTLALGALFSHLMQITRRPQTTIGHALALNTLGSALAPLIFGVLLLPALGAKLTLALIGSAYLVLYAMLGRHPPWYALTPLVSLLAVVLTPAALRIITIPAGGQLVAHRDGIMAAVSVVTDQRGHRHLKVNDRFQMGGTSSAFSDRREAHIPLLLHPQPRHALFLGVGAGVTFAAAAEHPEVKAVGIELIPEVLEMLPYFVDATGPIADNERLNLQAADARRFVASAAHRYDVVVADLFHPARDGAANLYTREHFAKIEALLSADGLFCQWLPLYQLDRRSLNTIIRTFLEIFPNANAWLAQYSVEAPILGLIGSKTDIRLAPDWLIKRVKQRSHYRALAAVGLHEPLALPGGFLGSAGTLKKFAGPGVINSDDHPVLLFQAPDNVYSDKGRPAELLMEVINGMKSAPTEILHGIEEKTTKAHSRLAAYWEARDRFITTGTTIDRISDPYALLRNIEAPLLATLKTSPDFLPAYAPLLRLANLLAETTPEASKALLHKLEQVAPNRSDATYLKQRLFNNH